MLPLSELVLHGGEYLTSEVFELIKLFFSMKRANNNIIMILIARYHDMAETQVRILTIITYQGSAAVPTKSL